MNKILIALLLALCVSGSYGERQPYPYTFSNTLDFSMVPSGLILMGLAGILEKRITPLDSVKTGELDRSNINSLDRVSTYNWSAGYDLASDILLTTLILSPLTSALPDQMQTGDEKRWRNIAQYSLMHSEVYLLSTGTVNLVKMLVRRKRPYLYNTALPISRRIELAKDPFAYKSFYSGHTSGAFAHAVFLSKTFLDIHGKSTANTFVWCASLSAAAFTGYTRIKAGKHYVTDVLTGAIAGSFFGYIVPYFHRKRGSTTPEVHSVGFTFRL